MAAARLATEPPGHTLQPTALVHEAYVGLIAGAQSQDWNGRGHFFAAAAEAMRRILVHQARSKQAENRGGQSRRVPLEEADIGFSPSADELLDIDEALTRLAAEDSQAARLIQLRYFGGLSLEDGAVVGISRTTRPASTGPTPRSASAPCWGQRHHHALRRRTGTQGDRLRRGQVA